MGRFDFPYELEPKRLVPCDYSIVSPNGLVIRDIDFDFCGKLREYYNKKKDDYFDSDYFHFPLRGVESSEIMKSEDRKINISFGLSYKGLHFGIFTILIAVLWLCILFPVLSRSLNFFMPNFFPLVVFSGRDFFSILAISAPIVVAIAVYGIDKQILRCFIETQMFLLAMAFLIELILFETDIFIFLMEILKQNWHLIL